MKYDDGDSEEMSESEVEQLCVGSGRRGGGRASGELKRKRGI